MTEKQGKELNESKSRYEKGLELYKQGRVSIGSNGLFKVSGYYDADTEKMTCTCPDYRNRKQTCKHLYASLQWTSNGHNNGSSNGFSTKDSQDTKETPRETKETSNKDGNRQATITRLAVLNTATEILKTHRKPIELTEVLSLASNLEQWAQGNTARK